MKSNKIYNETTCRIILDGKSKSLLCNINTFWVKCWYFEGWRRLLGSYSG